jgi:hypothetical protein
MDTVYITYRGLKRAVLHLVDAFTRWSYFYICKGDDSTGADTVAALE